jgi:hypothetical protein
LQDSFVLAVIRKHLEYIARNSHCDTFHPDWSGKAVSYLNYDFVYRLRIFATLNHLLHSTTKSLLHNQILWWKCTEMEASSMKHSETNSSKQKHVSITEITSKHWNASLPWIREWQWIRRENMCACLIIISHQSHVKILSAFSPGTRVFSGSYI